MGLRGDSEIVLDAKGRISIPAAYRDELSESCSGDLVVTKHPVDPCLVLHPLPVWEKIEDKLVAASSHDAASRRMVRNVIGRAVTVSMDKSNRILLPSGMREAANLNSTVWLIGIGNKFEIWSDTQWSGNYGAFTDEELNEIPDEIKDLVM